MKFRTQDSNLVLAGQSRVSFRLDQSGPVPPEGFEPPTTGLKVRDDNRFTTEAMGTPMASAFQSNAHTPLPFVGLQGVAPRVSRLRARHDARWSQTTRLRRAPAPYRSRAPKRKKPPRFSWAAPFHGMYDFLVERSPPSGVHAAIQARKDMDLLGAFAHALGKQRVRGPGPCPGLGFGLTRQARCVGREPHRFSR